MKPGAFVENRDRIGGFLMFGRRGELWEAAEMTVPTSQQGNVSGEVDSAESSTAGLDHSIALKIRTELDRG